MTTIIIQLIISLLFPNPEAPKSDNVKPIENTTTTNSDDVSTATFGGTSTWTEGG